MPLWLSGHAELGEKDAVRRLLRFLDARSLACAHTLECRDFMAGMWAAEVERAVAAAVERRADTALLVYGGSDDSMLALMEALGFLANNFLPPAAGFALEVRPVVDKSRNYSVRVLYHRPSLAPSSSSGFDTDFGIAELRGPCPGSKNYWCPGLASPFCLPPSVVNELGLVGKSFFEKLLRVWDPELPGKCGFPEPAPANASLAPQTEHKSHPIPRTLEMMSSVPYFTSSSF